MLAVSGGRGDKHTYKKNHITIQMRSFKEAFFQKKKIKHLGGMRRHRGRQEMMNNKRSLTSLEGDIILRTDIAAAKKPVQ